MSTIDRLSAFIEGIGVVGPGMENWSEARTILSGDATYQPQKTKYTVVTSLPAAERRRTGQVVKLALSVGLEALANADRRADDLPAVFASSEGDTYNCHAICEALTSTERIISPTRFHNSVTNASAGYWGIATGSMAASTVVCAFDASFCAGLLEALVQVTVDNTACILVAYDIDFPEPLRSVSSVSDGFGVAMVLTPERTKRSLAELHANMTQNDAVSCDDMGLESLRLTTPAARALPMLQLLAREASGVVVLEYLDTTQMALEITTCK